MLLAAGLAGEPALAQNTCLSSMGPADDVAVAALSGSVTYTYDNGATQGATMAWPAPLPSNCWEDFTGPGTSPTSTMLGTYYYVMKDYSVSTWDQVAVDLTASINLVAGATSLSRVSGDSRIKLTFDRKVRLTKSESALDTFNFGNQGRMKLRLGLDPLVVGTVFAPGTYSFNQKFDIPGLAVTGGVAGTSFIVNFEPSDLPATAFPAADTTTEITGISPSPVETGAPYTVSGTVTVDAAVGAGNLPGSVTITGDGAACVDASLEPLAGSPSVYAFTCEIVAGTVGEKTLTATYTDPAAQPAYLASLATRVHEVRSGSRVACEGFFPPVDSIPTVNRANAGRVIPLKWRCLDNGLPVTTAPQGWTITAGAVACTAGNSLDAIEEYYPGNSGLINHGNGYWQFNWATPKNYANQCRKVSVNFGGAPIQADFRFVR